MFVVHLDSHSMWIDESYSWRISRLGPVALIQDTAGDVHPPLYYLTLWAWMTWKGQRRPVHDAADGGDPGASGGGDCDPVGAQVVQQQLLGRGSGGCFPGDQRHGFRSFWVSL
jgi:hypothetical protein